ncbi:unnamed protein product [Prunus armeniaca]|uniref:Uncharacterized protein n=1 Tax=Prunus armeniaca TaxID=36596 RepID=A0A6J5U504_PRUAR|nr:unnamed protein product [Prunus armeniaca]CAB4301250.1 unnamed protein product [Prunus armeniaca]
MIAGFVQCGKPKEAVLYLEMEWKWAGVGGLGFKFSLEEEGGGSAGILECRSIFVTLDAVVQLSCHS